jgi:hypothetical protein
LACDSAFLWLRRVSLSTRSFRVLPSLDAAWPTKNSDPRQNLIKFSNYKYCTMSSEREVGRVGSSSSNSSSSSSAASVHLPGASDVAPRVPPPGAAAPHPTAAAIAVGGRDLYNQPYDLELPVTPLTPVATPPTLAAPSSFAGAAGAAARAAPQATTFTGIISGANAEHFATASGAVPAPWNAPG